MKGVHMSYQNLTLLTDLYELTMMQGYYKNKSRNDTVIFDMFYRTNPLDNGYAIAAGLEQMIDYIKNLHFSLLLIFHHVLNVGKLHQNTSVEYLICFQLCSKINSYQFRNLLHFPQ